MSTAVLKGLAQEPWGLGRRELRARLSLIGGDGAAVRGGADRKKPGTRCAEHMWADLHPLPEGDEMLAAEINMEAGRRIDLHVGDDALHFCTEWDKFHREDIALHRAIKRSAQAEELYAVTAAMDHLFHMGDGRLLLQSAADAVGIESRSGWMPSLTRKAVGLASEPGNLVANFAAYAAGLHARREWKRDGHGSNVTLGEFVDIGRRLVSVDFVAFALTFRDMMRFAVSPWSLAVQSASFEPWVLQRKKAAHDAHLPQAASALRWSRQLLRILILLRQHATSADTRSFVRACMFARPTDLFDSARDDAHAAQPWGKFEGVKFVFLA